MVRYEPFVNTTVLPISFQWTNDTDDTKLRHSIYTWWTWSDLSYHRQIWLVISRLMFQKKGNLSLACIRHFSIFFTKRKLQGVWLLMQKGISRCLANYCGLVRVLYLPSFCSRRDRDRDIALFRRLNSINWYRWRLDWYRLTESFNKRLISTRYDLIVMNWFHQCRLFDMFFIWELDLIAK